MDQRYATHPNWEAAAVGVLAAGAAASLLFPFALPVGDPAPAPTPLLGVMMALPFVAALVALRVLGPRMDR